MIHYKSVFLLICVILTLWFASYDDFLLFFTNWSWILNCIYFAVNSQSLFLVAASCTWIVSLAFWTLLGIGQSLSADEKIALVFQHSVNVIMMLFETFMITDFKVEWYDVIYVDAFIMFYVLVIVLLRVTLKINWPYPFFEYLQVSGGDILTVVGVLIIGNLGFITTRGLLKMNKYKSRDGMRDSLLPAASET